MFNLSAADGAHAL